VSETPKLRKPSYVKVERENRAKVFKLMCDRFFQSMDDLLEGLGCTLGEYHAWCMGLEPIPKDRMQILKAKAEPYTARDRELKRVPPARASGPNTRLGISTPDKDYSTIYGAAKAHGIAVETARARAKRGTDGWSFIDYSDPEVTKPPRRGRPRKQDYRVVVEEHRELVGPKQVKAKDGAVTITPLQTVVVPEQIFPDIWSAAAAHHIPYHTAYKRLATNACGWRREIL
jgi:hypothetical protein